MPLDYLPYPIQAGLCKISTIFYIYSHNQLYKGRDVIETHFSRSHFSPSDLSDFDNFDEFDDQPISGVD